MNVEVVVVACVLNVKMTHWFGQDVEENKDLYEALAADENEGGK